MNMSVPAMAEAKFVVSERGEISTGNDSSGNDAGIHVESITDSDNSNAHGGNG